MPGRGAGGQKTFRARNKQSSLHGRVLWDMSRRSARVAELEITRAQYPMICLFGLIAVASRMGSEAR
eukprot:6434983-Lingulodinium_polyedra.AAC.1